MKFRRADNVVLQLVDERAFLLDEQGTEMIVLNAVGTMVWAALDKPCDAGAIAASLQDRFDDVTLAQLDGDVRDFLDELAELGLVAPIKER